MKKFLKEQTGKDIVSTITLIFVFCIIAWFSSLGAALDSAKTWQWLIYFVIPFFAALYALLEAEIRASMFVVFATEFLYCMGLLGYILITFDQALYFTWFDFIRYFLIISTLFYCVYFISLFLKKRRENHGSNQRSGTT